MTSKTDPELKRQIAQAGTGSHSIQALFSLGISSRESTSSGPREAATRVIRRAEDQLGYKPCYVHIFDVLGSFSVYADAMFLQKIIEDPEVSLALSC